MRTNSFPRHYNPATAGQWDYRPNHRQLFLDAVEWRKTHGIKAAATDKVKITLLGIDLQKDFCFPPVFDKGGKWIGGGALYVGGRSGTGAVDDSRRLAEFIYRNLGIITSIRRTFDTHFAFQIFSPSMWMKDDGITPADPFTEIPLDTILANKFQVNPAAAGLLAKGNLGWLRQQVTHYAKELEKAGKYKLYIWPEHCILGDEGHALVGTVQEASMFHAYVRSAQSESEVKGGHPLTENYSVLGPEVTTYFDGRPMAQKNARFVQALLESDYVIVGGQAASHCVAWSVNDLLSEIKVKAPAMAEKVYVLTDCMSAVTVPDGKGGFFADYTPEVEKAMAAWESEGMKLVKSTDPVDTWPGFNL